VYEKERAMTLPIQEPVTGHEEISDSGEPLAALAQFYRALNRRDMALMEQNWDATDEAAMDNPLGGIKRGWAEIRNVYERLFGGANQYQFEFYDYTLQRYGEVFIAISRERGQFVTEDGLPIDLLIRTTRIFRWADGWWRQIHHHGSIDNPDMLARYQQAVLKRIA
jgi:ketosteroid isomerase-like protein